MESLNSSVIISLLNALRTNRDQEIIRIERPVLDMEFAFNRESPSGIHLCPGLINRQIMEPGTGADINSRNSCTI